MRFVGVSCLARVYFSNVTIGREAGDVFGDRFLCALFGCHAWRIPLREYPLLFSHPAVSPGWVCNRNERDFVSACVSSSLVCSRIQPASALLLKSLDVAGG